MSPKPIRNPSATFFLFFSNTNPSATFFLLFFKYKSFGNLCQCCRDNGCSSATTSASERPAAPGVVPRRGRRPPQRAARRAPAHRHARPRHPLRARRCRAVPPLGAPPARAPGARLPRQRRAPAGGGATTSAPPSSSPSSEGAATTPPGGSSRHPWRGTSAATCGAWPSPSPASSTPACQQARGGVLRDERRPPHRLRPPADQHGHRLVGCRGAGGRHQARAVAPP